MEKFTDSQIQLQSLIESDLVPPLNLELTMGIATIEYPSTHISYIAEKVVKSILDGRSDVAKYNFAPLFQIMLTGRKMLTLNFRNSSLYMGLASQNSEAPGAIGMVCKESDMGYLGRVNLDSTLYLVPAGRKVRSELVSLIMEINNAPEVMIAEHGKSAGKCPLCGTILIPNDLQIGFDPKCAATFNFKHPDLDLSIINIAKPVPDSVIFPADAMQGILAEFKGTRGR